MSSSTGTVVIRAGEGPVHLLCTSRSRSRNALRAGRSQAVPCRHATENSGAGLTAGSTENLKQNLGKTNE